METVLRAGSPRRYRALSARDLDRIPGFAALGPEEILEARAVAAVIPFRVNSYIIEQLIDWSAAPDDPIYRLYFPRPEMLDPPDLLRMVRLLTRDAPIREIRAAARRIRATMNPHPAGQTGANVPLLDGEPLPGMQHKYRETVLFFPSQGQTCHAFCAYCFRWPQFAGGEELRFANRETGRLVLYLSRHPEVSDVLVTGGDPLVMRAGTLETYLDPLLDARLSRVANIRIGTRALASWPYRFLDDPDADELLGLFEKIVATGRHLAVMAHYAHPRELQTEAAREALRRVLGTGATVRCQSPVVRHVNDRGDLWAEMWRLQVRLGAIPYYMFVARDTGPRRYFELPLARCLEIYQRAIRRVSGLARTVRGPSMSTNVGKVLLEGAARIAGEDVFVLSLIQAREPCWVGRPFLARFDPDATWFDALRPAFGEEFFFARALDELQRMDRGSPWFWRRGVDSSGKPVDRFLWS